MNPKNANGGQTRSTFTSVPADDGFRNYMARKIELQRKQFGLIVPPPPPPPPPPTDELPLVILEKAKTTKTSGHAFDSSDVAGPKLTDANSTKKKSVRFHENVDIEGVTQVLKILKRKHTGEKSSRLSSARTRQRKLRGMTSDSDRESPTDYDDVADYMSVDEEKNKSDKECASILGVLDKLQKRYGTSCLKKKTPYTAEGLPTCKGTSLLEEVLEPASHEDKPTAYDCLGQRYPGGHLHELSKSLESGISQLTQHSPASSAKSVTHMSPIIRTEAPPMKSSRKPNHRPDLFFMGVIVLVNGHTSPDATTLMRLLHKYGGDLEKYETQRVTHIIAEQLSAAKANIYKHQKKPTPVCRPEWITDSVACGKLLPFGNYLLENVRDRDVVGIKSVKSFFRPPMDKELKDNATSPEKAPNECSADEPKSQHRWQDKHPAEANYHINGQVRTVGNDPHFLESYFSNSRLSYIGSFKQRVKPAKQTAGSSQSKVGARKFVLLVDMDCFFASVALRKYPQYKDKPVAVGHSHVGRSNVNDNMTKTRSENSSSELSTCNYIARKHGIQKGMFLGAWPFQATLLHLTSNFVTELPFANIINWPKNFLGDAIALCPDLVVLPYDFEGFEEVSGVVADLLHGYAEQYNGCVEQVSCDESYVEININSNDTGNDIYAFVNSIAESIRTDIVRNTACTASIGIGPNKVCCDFFVQKLSFHCFECFHSTPESS